MTDSDDQTPGLGDDADAATPSEERGSQSESGYFVLRLGGSLYAVPPETVDHVSPMLTPVRVPTAASHLLGVVHIRGRIITVVDLPQVLGSTEHSASQRESELGRRLVVLNAEGGRFGTEATEVYGLRFVKDETIRPFQDAVVETSDFFAGQFEGPEGVITILRTDALYESLLSRGGGDELTSD